MKVKDIISSSLVDEATVVLIRKNDIACIREDLLASGHWYEDNVLEYMGYTVKKAFWYDSNRLVVYIDVNGDK